MKYADPLSLRGWCYSFSPKTVPSSPALLCCDWLLVALTTSPESFSNFMKGSALSIHYSMIFPKTEVAFVPKPNQTMPEKVKERKKSLKSKNQSDIWDTKPGLLSDSSTSPYFQ